MKYLQGYRIITLASLVSLAACHDSPTISVSSFESQEKAHAHNEIVIQEVASSRPALSYSAGQIQMSYQLLDLPIIGVESRLKLKFELPAMQNLHLTFSNNRNIELSQHNESVYTGTKDGLIDVIIRFKAVQAGKTYLKFIARTADGDKIRAFAVALPVADQSGAVPEKKKSAKSRINLPSSH